MSVAGTERLVTLVARADEFAGKLSAAIKTIDEAGLVEAPGRGEMPWEPLRRLAGSDVDELLTATRGVASTPQGAAARSAAARVLLGERLLRPLDAAVADHGGLQDSARLRLAEALDAFRYAEDDLAVAAGHDAGHSARRPVVVTPFETIIDRSAGATASRRTGFSGRAAADAADLTPQPLPGHHPGVDALAAGDRSGIGFRMYPYHERQSRYWTHATDLAQHHTRRDARAAAESITRADTRSVGATIELGDGTPAPSRFASMRVDVPQDTGFEWGRADLEAHIAVAGPGEEFAGSAIRGVELVLPLRDGSGVRVARVAHAMPSGSGTQVVPLPHGSPM